MFESVDDVRERFAGEGYIADEPLATTVFLQTRLDKPLLIEGPAGVGKTELAKVLAAATGRRLLRLQCYEGQDETKALYEWDYGKQLLYTQILREKIGQIVSDATDLEEAVDRIGAQESVFFSDRFLAPRPLLEAVRSEERWCCLSTRSIAPTRRWRQCCWNYLGSTRFRCPRSEHSPPSTRRT